jgi:hypothetical protein
MRDIEKDKEMLLAIGPPQSWTFRNENEMVFGIQALEDVYPALVYWIAQYEHLQTVYGEVYESYERITNDMEKDYYRLRDRYEAAQARIHELEELLRKDSEKTP